TTKNQLYAYTVNYWMIWGFMLDDHLDNLELNNENKHIICEWQKKVLLGESDGTTGFDTMLVKAMKLTKDMLTADQFVRQVMYTISWIGTYLTSVARKYSVKPV
ncbi:unnamed protein product, partial [Medioppia subpectinata]